MSELLDEVLRAIRDQDTEAAAKVRSERLIDGKLLVTPKQYDAIVRACQDAEWDHGRRIGDALTPLLSPHIGDPAAWSRVPVVVVKPGPPQHLGGGKWAVVGPDDSIYVFTPPPEAGLVSGAP